jgi:hypothetical protein
VATAVVLLVASAAAQDSSAVRCVVGLYRLRGEDWMLIRTVKFSPLIREEELTNKRIRLAGRGLWLYASVFPTDESMRSARGADSLKLGLAISSTAARSAFDINNNAVAEGTLATLDTLRVQRTSYVSHRPMLAMLECWDSELQKEQRWAQ